ncbi:MAG: hypothetical protein LBH73_00795 [Spirochaetaceae bacterium]|jgi:hypothetical protein|nr:hypothetical protein [Spirochaetaceae bacterium]
MRKAIVPRFMGLLLLYSLVLAALVLIQFSRRSSFTHRMGNLVVRGYYADESNAGEEDQDESSGRENDYALAGEASVLFGGIEFRVSGDDGLVMTGKDGTLVKLFPASMRLDEEQVRFHFSEELSLEFGVHAPGGSQELRIQGALPQDMDTLEIPYRPLRSSRSGDGADGQFVVAVSGDRYTFTNTNLDEARRRLVLSRERPNAYYGLIPEKKPFNAQDYILSDARDTNTYNVAIARWRGQAFSLWSRTIGNNPTEKTVAAYLGESLPQGNYRQAVASIPASFLNSNQRSHYSSAYLGRLDLGLRAIAASDREFLSRISRLINEKSLEFLQESHCIYNLSVRGAETFLNDCIAILKSQTTTPEIDELPGIFEGWTDWQRLYPGRENPFEPLIAQACSLVAETIQKSFEGDMILVVQHNEADTEYNLRLGSALAAYGVAADREDWAFVGRSIVITVLNLSGDSGSAPVKIRFNPDGSLQNTAENRVDLASLYRILENSTYAPRALAITAGNPGMWTWTAAASISSRNTQTALEIAVNFPAGETHYMIIRGVRPFAKIQLYDIDYRTDPQFERYDSSGWAYSPSEQTLIIKMKHKTQVEYVRIFHQPPAAPAPATPAAPPAGPATSAAPAAAPATPAAPTTSAVPDASPEN